ncbi:MAG TPA: hypothetical protein VMS22_08210 [Candidatus Eisenbacteria bacterium]|nr:hypothetical protein [Candidatus Eisenbacteria bacterium]
MRRSILPIITAIALLAAPGLAGARSLERKLSDASQTVGIAPTSAFDAFADNIADFAARALPITSASAGFTYRYNPTLEVFERTSETLGPVFLERPDTLGRNKFNVSVSFQYVEFNEFDGTQLTRLQNNDPIVTTAFDAGGNQIGFRAQTLRYSLALQNYVTTVSFTWGVLDDLDLNILLPIIATNMRLGVHAQEVATAGLDGVFTPSTGPERVGYENGNPVGVGDILLRAKYQLPRLDWLRSAAGLVLRLPSGSHGNFQGTGDVEVSPFLYLSTVLWDRVEPTMNLGIDYDASNVSKSAASYGIGVDVDITKRINFNLAYLGRSQFEGTAEPDDTSFLHLSNGQTVSEPLLGLNFGRKDTSDLSFGIRVVVWGNVMLYANGIYALNDQGLRNDTVIPAGGIEGTF